MRESDSSDDENRFDYFVVDKLSTTVNFYLLKENIEQSMYCFISRRFLVSPGNILFYNKFTFSP